MEFSFLDPYFGQIFNHSIAISCTILSISCIKYIKFHTILCTKSGYFVRQKSLFSTISTSNFHLFSIFFKLYLKIFKKKIYIFFGLCFCDYNNFDNIVINLFFNDLNIFYTLEYLLILISICITFSLYAKIFL